MASDRTEDRLSAPFHDGMGTRDLRAPVWTAGVGLFLLSSLVLIGSLLWLPDPTLAQRESLAAAGLLALACWSSLAIYLLKAWSLSEQRSRAAFEQSVAGIGLIGPSKAAILMTIEPLVGIAVAARLLGEQPTALQILGGAAVLTAVIILQLTPSRVPPEPEFGPLV